MCACDACGVRIICRIIKRDRRPLFHGKLIFYRWCGDDKREPEFTLQALLNDLQVKQAQESAPEPRTEGSRGVFFVDKRGIIKLELLQGHCQVLITLRSSRVERGKDYRLYLSEAGQRRCTGTMIVRDRISAPGIAYCLYPCDDVTDLAGCEHVFGYSLDLEDADLFHPMGGVIVHKAYCVAGF